ncbi:hypothetical protein ACROYT_G042231 [Oculina patagonica]
MQQFSRWNKGFRYLLMVLDVFSKYGWIVPLKDKKGETVTQAFITIFKEGRKPQYLWTDKGKEYYNKNIKELLEKNGITLYSTENEEKSSVCERWNRTIKTQMWKQFTVQGNTQYLDMLPKLVKEYNNTKHSSIKMTPTEASKKKNEGIVYFNLYGNMEQVSSKPKFKIGDKIRISKYKRKVFDKGYTPNWSEEIFKINKIQYTNPITYKLKDLNNEEIGGSFYEPELLKAEQEVFRINKVIRRNYKKNLALIPNHTGDDCPLMIISCPYVKMGCETKIQRKQVESHLQSAMRFHLDLACVKLNDAEEKLECLQRRLEEKISNNQGNTTEEKIVMVKNVFVWKINDFKEILRKARSEENIRIGSAPFYTESYGYKMKVEIYPNGQSSGKNTHLSVFIYVMKGEYDAILPWPFKKKVKITLIDQQEDLVERQNDTGQLFLGNYPQCSTRPMKEANISTGFPAFISHKKLYSRRYLVDDTVFLQVEVGPSSS